MPNSRENDIRTCSPFILGNRLLKLLYLGLQLLDDWSHCRLWEALVDVLRAVHVPSLYRKQNGPFDSTGVAAITKLFEELRVWTHVSVPVRSAKAPTIRLSHTGNGMTSDNKSDEQSDKCLHTLCVRRDLNDQ